MRSKKVTAVLILAVSLAACRVPVAGGRGPVQLDDYSDVPVPAAMVKDREHSMRLEVPAVGSLVNVYREGGLTVDGLTDHFLKQMPDLGWHLVSRFQSQVTVLVFQKEARLCLLGIGIDRGATTLSVLVGALGAPGTAAPPQRNPGD